MRTRSQTRYRMSYPGAQKEFGVIILKQNITLIILGKLYSSGKVFFSTRNVKDWVSIEPNEVEHVMLMSYPFWIS